MICNSLNCQAATLLNLLLLHVLYHDRAGLEPATFGQNGADALPTELTAADITTFRFSLAPPIGLEPTISTVTGWHPLHWTARVYMFVTVRGFEP